MTVNPFRNLISKFPRFYPYLILNFMAISILLPTSTLASVSKVFQDKVNLVSFQSIQESNSSELHASPSITTEVNLPFVEQNAPPATPTPMNGYPVPVLVTPIATFTPTVTPIPVQTGSTNVPIVIGAFAIIIVVLLAWFFVGYLPRRTDR